MTKAALYGGSATALVALGYYAGKRRAASEMGASTGVSEFDYTATMPKLAASVARQVTYAQAGSWLSDASEAENFATFSRPAAYDARAYYTVAYFQAVAARVLKSRVLAARAAATAAKASALYALPGSSLLTGSASSIVRAGANALRVASSNPKIQPILEAMDSAGDPDAVLAAQKTRAESSIRTYPERRVKEQFPWWVTYGKYLLLGGAVVMVGGTIVLVRRGRNVPPERQISADSKE